VKILPGGQPAAEKRIVFVPADNFKGNYEAVGKSPALQGKGVIIAVHLAAGRLKVDRSRALRRHRHPLPQFLKILEMAKLCRLTPDAPRVPDHSNRSFHILHRVTLDKPALDSRADDRTHLRLELDSADIDAGTESQSERSGCQQHPEGKDNPVR